VGKQVRLLPHDEDRSIAKNAGERSALTVDPVLIGPAEFIGPFQREHCLRRFASRDAGAEISKGNGRAAARAVGIHEHDPCELRDSLPLRGFQFDNARPIQEAGDAIHETGFRKFRWIDSRRGKGRSGGLQIIYDYFAIGIAGLADDSLRQ
jgi:hypothetical protein